VEVNEATVRFLAFACVFSACAILEACFPRRKRRWPRLRRWVNHVGIAGVNQLIARIVLPTSAVAVAAYCATQSWGLLNLVNWPGALEWLLGLLLLDLAIYGQHVMFHRVPFFWRFHLMHHADTDFDVTTGIRFHPLSILLSAAIKLGVVFILGPPVIAVVVFEILLNASSMFNHSNLHIPLHIDRWLRLVIVTPDVHRVHHSTDPCETNSNYGFNFPWWDRLFSTYTAQPASPHEEMALGLSQFRDGQELNVVRLLTQPFRVRD
jgi:sterol desaturase/sphingolipid hydroxylase (fatty acid hydroxylase superfamily)